MVEMLFLYTGSLIALVSFVLFIFKKNKKKSDPFLGMLFFNCMFLLLFNAFSEPSKSNFVLHNLLDMFSYYSYISCPPLIFMYIFTSTQFQAKVSNKNLLVFVPILIYYAVFTGFMIYYIPLFTTDLFFEVMPDTGTYMPFKVAFDTANFAIFCCYFLAAGIYLATLRPRKNANHIIPFIFFTVFICSIFMVAIFQFFNLFLFSGVSIIVAIIVFDVLVFRYPDIDRVISVSAAKRKYKHSQLTKLNTDQVKSNLEKLFSEERIHLDEKLDISQVAKQLSITVHQLSEYINTYEEKSFSTYVNEYRIGSALEILEKDPDMKITALSFEVGFNTVATFYKYFKQVTGMKPLEYIRTRS